MLSSPPPVVTFMASMPLSMRFMKTCCSTASEVRPVRHAGEISDCPEQPARLGYCFPGSCRGQNFEAKEAPLRLTYGPSRACLLAGVLFYGAATSLAQTETTPCSSAPGQPIPGTLGVSPFQ